MTKVKKQVCWHYRTFRYLEDRMRLGRAKARLAAPKPLRLGHAQGGKFLGIALGSTGAFASASTFAIFPLRKVKTTP